MSPGKRCFAPNFNQKEHISISFEMFFNNWISNVEIHSIFCSVITTFHDTAWACAWIPTRGLTVRLPEGWPVFITMSNCLV